MLSGMLCIYIFLHFFINLWVCLWSVNELHVVW